MTAISSLLSRIRRDQDHASAAGAEYVGLNHPTVYALLTIIEDQQAALTLCRDAAPEFASRHAARVLARMEVLAAEVQS